MPGVGFVTGKTKKSRHGGPRPNSGRPKGRKNAATLQKEAMHKEVLVRAMDGAETPLEVMLGIMRDPGTEPQMRFEAAKAAAPYVHPRLSQVDSTVTHKNDAADLTEDELAAIARRGSTGVAEPANSSAKSHKIH